MSEVVEQGDPVEQAMKTIEAWEADLAGAFGFQAAKATGEWLQALRGLAQVQPATARLAYQRTKSLLEELGRECGYEPHGD